MDFPRGSLGEELALVRDDGKLKNVHRKCQSFLKLQRLAIYTNTIKATKEFTISGKEKIGSYVKYLYCLEKPCKV